jgi:IS4 transposase
VEHVETYGDFTPCSAGSLTGKRECAQAHLCRRIRVKLDQATRDGDRVLSMLTNLPLRQASATRVARLYRKRWTLETAFQPLEAYFHAAIKT